MGEITRFIGVFSKKDNLSGQKHGYRESLDPGTLKLPESQKYPSLKIKNCFRNPLSQKRIIMKHIVLFVFVILLAPSASGQEIENRFETKIGYGYYQGINIGFSYFYTSKLKIGLEVGSHLGLPPLKDEKHYNFQIENTLYFGRLSKQNVGGWYFNQQLMYWAQGQSNHRWKIITLGLNFGKTIAITKRIGLDMEFGPAFNLVVDIKHDPSVEESGWMWPILYNGRIHLTYKF